MTPAERKASLADFCAVRDADPRDERAFLRARARVVRENTGIVYSAAYRLAKRRSIEPEDAVQYGYEGFLRALKTYDHARGWLLTTYSTPWVQAYILLGAELEETIRKPGDVHDRHIKLRRIAAEFEGDAGRRPTDQELAELAHVELAHVIRDRRTQWGAGPSMDEEVSHEHGHSKSSTLGDTVPSPAPSAQSQLEVAESDAAVHALLLLLKPRERDILLRRFAHDPETLESIGQSMNRSRERIRQIEAGALKALRRAAGERASDG